MDRHLILGQGKSSQDDDDVVLVSVITITSNFSYEVGSSGERPTW